MMLADKGRSDDALQLALLSMIAFREAISIPTNKG